jgi:hypothetical protein
MDAQAYVKTDSPCTYIGNQSPFHFAQAGINQRTNQFAIACGGPGQPWSGSLVRAMLAGEANRSAPKGVWGRNMRGGLV